MEFKGLKSEKPESVGKNDDFVTIVVSINAVNAAKDYFERIGKERSEYIFIADTFLDADDFYNGATNERK